MNNSSDHPQRPVRVVLVEDDLATRARFELALKSGPEVQLVASFGDGRSALAWLEHSAPDVLLCDLGLPDLPGLAVISYCAQRYPKTDVMVITLYDDEAHVMRSLEAGASGYLLKDSLDGEILEHVRELHAGGAPMSPVIARQVLRRFHRNKTSASRPEVGVTATQLTPKELVVLNRIAQGFSASEIARLESISANTVATHIKRIYGKLAVHSRTEAVFEAMQIGLLDVGQSQIRVTRE